ncbi:hypothetical protein GCM10010971_29340 [Silvimonas amylolytica]|uniref:Uncharacterized protein n=1 Tax=Silvimonas amylolytica TaxID=449663 RepID=A0ABQ2PP08_9NEIS|nr:hypothetical protein GCM10010971_29340 [Silvimonas amylolytica]
MRHQIALRGIWVPRKKTHGFVFHMGEFLRVIPHRPVLTGAVEVHDGVDRFKDRLGRVAVLTVDIINCILHDG